MNWIKYNRKLIRQCEILWDMFMVIIQQNGPKIGKVCQSTEWPKNQCSTWKNVHNLTLIVLHNSIIYSKVDGKSIEIDSWVTLSVNDNHFCWSVKLQNKSDNTLSTSPADVTAIELEDIWVRVSISHKCFLNFAQ